MSCAPKLIWVQGGTTGFYSPGLVVLGEANLVDLAATVFENNFEPVGTARSLFLRRYYPNIPIASEDDVFRELVCYVIAHELGHALQGGEDLGLSRVELECDADVTAGHFARLFGWNAAIQRMIAAEIGCTGPSWSCTHPRSEERVRCYTEGREAQRRAELQPTPPAWFG